MPFIDIIIPVYNTSEYLETCLQSIHNQKFKDWRGIIIDDKSTDNSLEICQKWAQKDPRFEIIALPENKGLSNVRNVGLQHISAPYFTSVDSDDYIGENHLQTIYKAIVDKNSDIIMNGYTSVYTDGRKRKVKQMMKPYVTITNPQLLEMVIMDNISSHIWKFSFKTSFIKENNFQFWDYTIYEDFSLFALIASKANSLTHTGQSDYFYRINPQGIVSSTKKNAYKTYIYFLALCRRFDITQNATFFDESTKKALHIWTVKGLIKTFNNYLSMIKDNNDISDHLLFMKEELQKRNIKIITKGLFFYKFWTSLCKRYYELIFKLKH